MEETIDLRQLVEIIRKRIWIIVTIPLIATLISGIVSFFVLTPIYEASTQLLVNKSESKTDILMPSYNDIQANLKLVETYSVIINSPRILEKSIQEHGWALTASELKEKIKVSPVQNSQVMSITVSDPDPLMAIKMANGVATTFKQEIKGIMNVDNVQVLAEAKPLETYSPVKPKPLLNMAIAFVVGLMTGVGVVFLLEYMDNTIRSEEDVESLLGLSVLASIAKVDEKNEKNLKSGGLLEAPLGGKHFEA